MNHQEDHKSSSGGSNRGSHGVAASPYRERRSTEAAKSPLRNKGLSPASSSPGVRSRPSDPTEGLVASIPKFGQWDVNNPASADDFSAIFQKAVDQKRGELGGSQNEINTPSSSFPRSDHKQMSFMERICCCFTKRPRDR